MPVSNSSFTVPVNFTIREPYKEYKTHPCLKITSGFICKTEKTKYKTVVRITDITKYNSTHRCCNGYKEYKEQCLPECALCVHGTCVRPDVCICNGRFVGKHCDRSKLFLFTNICLFSLKDQEL